MSRRGNNRNRLIVPECANALNQMKFEIAAELGVPIAGGAGNLDAEFAGELGSLSASGQGQQYMGDLTSREAGSLGGGITKRLVRLAQQSEL